MPHTKNRRKKHQNGDPDIVRLRADLAKIDNIESSLHKEEEEEELQVTEDDDDNLEEADSQEEKEEIDMVRETQAKALTKGKEKGKGQQVSVRSAFDVNRMDIEDNSQESNSLARRLASPLLKDRTKAFKIFRDWVTRRSVIDENEFHKIWRGIFYCFWMSDKVLVQQELSKRLASIPNYLMENCNKQNNPFARALGYLNGFYVCMVREWSFIDRLRLDKFMSLVRHFLFSTFQLAHSQKFEEQYLTQIIHLLHHNHGPLALDHSFNNRGVYLHLADIYIDEIDRIISTYYNNNQINNNYNKNNINDKSKKNNEVDDLAHMSLSVIHRLLSPFYSCLSSCNDETLFARVYHSVFDNIIKAANLAIHLSSASSNNDGDNSDDNDEESDSENSSNHLQFGFHLISLHDWAKSFSIKLDKCASSRTISPKQRNLIYQLKAKFDKHKNTETPLDGPEADSTVLGSESTTTSIQDQLELAEATSQMALIQKELQAMKKAKNLNGRSDNLESNSNSIKDKKRKSQEIKSIKIVTESQKQSQPQQLVQVEDDSSSNLPPSSFLLHPSKKSRLSIKTQSTSSGSSTSVSSLSINSSSTKVSMSSKNYEAKLSASDNLEDKTPLSDSYFSQREEDGIELSETSNIEQDLMERSFHSQAKKSLSQGLETSKIKVKSPYSSSSSPSPSPSASTATQSLTSLLSRKLKKANELSLLFKSSKVVLDSYSDENPSEEYDSIGKIINSKSSKSLNLALTEEESHSESSPINSIGNQKNKNLKPQSLPRPSSSNVSVTPGHSRNYESPLPSSNHKTNKEKEKEAVAVTPKSNKLITPPPHSHVPLPVQVPVPVSERKKVNFVLDNNKIQEFDKFQTIEKPHPIELLLSRKSPRSAIKSSSLESIVNGNWVPGRTDSSKGNRISNSTSKSKASKLSLPIDTEEESDPVKQLNFASPTRPKAQDFF